MSKQHKTKGFVVAGTRSGAGKTTITMGLMAALVRRGLSVAPFKVGPDFIDPGHHARITGVTSRNLDGWMLSRAYNLECFRKHSETADFAVVEGVMGLFDGYEGKSEAGSTAQMAKWLGLPVVLVADAKSMARSAAALVQGFERFDRDLRFAGLLFNHVGSKRHLSYLEDAISDHVEMPFLGGIIQNRAIEIPERHLGLVTREEHSLQEEDVNRLADLVENNMDVDALIRTSEIRPNKNEECQSCTLAAPPDHGQSTTLALPVDSPVRIGVAMDKAFCFYYQDNLDMLEELGAEIVPFSPVETNALPRDLDGIYFGGGYPELFAEQLAGNARLRRQIREKSMAGMPIYGECGGFMYLCKDIRDTQGNVWPMTGCFPFSTAMSPRLRSLGYREITLQEDTIIGKRGQVLRGHEFHYSEIISDPKDSQIETVYGVTSRMGQSKISEGYGIARTLGSYVHLHFGSQPDAVRCFVGACRG